MTSVLVVFGSKHGSTAEIAGAITETLCELGLDARCVKAAEVNDVGAYDAVVLGSAVYMRRWRQEARRFLRRHATELSARPFWVFSSGPVGDPGRDDPSWTEPAETFAEAMRLGARDHIVFGGSLPSPPTGPVELMMASGIPPEFHDRRDWEDIRVWARGIAAELGVADTR